MDNKRLIDVSKLEAVLQNFADERNWNQYHSPKNLAMALTGELGELVEIFQWLTEEQSREAARDPGHARQNSSTAVSSALVAPPPVSKKTW